MGKRMMGQEPPFHVLRPSVPTPEREKSLVLESVCMEAGITRGGRREGRTLLFPSGLFCPLFTQRKEEGKAGREGGGKGDPEKRGSDIRDEKVGDSPIAR